MSEKEDKATEKVEEAKVETTPEVAGKFSQEDVNDFLAEQKKTIGNLQDQVKGLSKKQSEAVQEANRLRNLPQSSENTEILEGILKLIPQQKDEYGNATTQSPEVASLQRKLTVAKQRDIRKQREAYAEGERQKMRKDAEDVGLDPDGKELALVELAWDNNNPTAARKWLNRAIKEHQPEVKPKGDNVKETEEEMEKRIRADVVKELTKQDTASPVGAGTRTFTSAEIADRGFYEAHREEILKANAEGRIED